MAIKKRVILAAGHGGGDSGAVGQGTTEAKQTVSITNKVVARLKKTNIEVVLVPHSLGLVDSINWVNHRYKGLNDGISIEIHKNAGGGTGSEVWTPSHPDGTAKHYSKVIADHLHKATGLPNRGVKQAQNNRWGRLGWTDDTNTYACLIEAGFIDVDPVSDAMNNKFAKGIADGIVAYFGGKQVEDKKPMPKPPAKKKSEDTIVDEVIAGKWGNGEDRKSALSRAGYNHGSIQAKVNKKLAGKSSKPAAKPSKKSDLQVAREIAAGVGGWGNGADRKKKLESKGYNYNTVQSKVNELMGVAPSNEKNLKVGNAVMVTHAVDYYGTPIYVSGSYTLMELKGDRAVIGRGGKVTAAIRASRLRKV